MPLVPGTVARREATFISSTILDLRGKRRAASIPVSPTATTLQIGLILDAIGNASNGAQVTRNVTTVNEVVNERNPDVVVFDEAYPSTDQVAVFIFQDDAGNAQSLEVPAPDATLFDDANRDIINPSAVRSAAIIDAVVAALNQGGGSYVYARGYLATRRSRRTQPRIVPTNSQVVEPAVDDLPGPNPGT